MFVYNLLFSLVSFIAKSESVFWTVNWEGLVRFANSLLTPWYLSKIQMIISKPGEFFSLTVLLSYNLILWTNVIL